MIFRLLLVASLFSLVGNAQAQRNYATTSAEYIFSLSQTAAADSVDVEDVLRFSGFANTGYQRHFDFGSTVGLFTGVNVRNVGMITKVDTLRLKHRAYALAVPLEREASETDDPPNPKDLPSGDVLAREFQRFLRQRGPE